MHSCIFSLCDELWEQVYALQKKKVPPKMRNTFWRKSDLVRSSVREILDQAVGELYS